MPRGKSVTKGFGRVAAVKKVSIETTVSFEGREVALILSEHMKRNHGVDIEPEAWVFRGFSETESDQDPITIRDLASVEAKSRTEGK